MEFYEITTRYNLTGTHLGPFSKQKTFLIRINKFVGNSVKIVTIIII